MASHNTVALAPASDLAPHPSVVEDHPGTPPTTAPAHTAHHTIAQPLAIAHFVDHRAFKPVGGGGVYIECRVSGVSTPGSVYRFASIIIPDQLPSIPLREIPRRLLMANKILDDIRRILWTAFADICETKTAQSAVARRIAFALGEASMPRTPIETTTEQWIISQENLLRAAEADLAELEGIVHQYVYARKFVNDHGHFDDTIPLCGQAHVDALGEKLQKVYLERKAAEDMRAEFELYRKEKKAVRHLGQEAIDKWQATRVARGVVWGTAHSIYTNA